MSWPSRRPPSESPRPPSARVSNAAATADILGLAAIVAGGVSVWLTISALSTDDASVAVGPGGVTLFARF